MSGLFLKLLNMSISASVLIVVVVLARCLLRRSPKWIHCILWALVGIRLLCVYASLALCTAVIPPAFRAVNQKIVPYDTAVGRGIGKAYAALFPGA